MFVSNEHYQNIATKTIEFIGAHLGEPLPIERLAKNAGYSESRFRTIFRKVTGKNVLSYILSMRMEKSQRLLQNTDKGVSEIAFAAGFGSHEQFCHLFKKKTGLSPSAFRNTSREMRSLAEPRPATSRPDEPREWFGQKFQGEDINENWKISAGRIENQRDAATGVGDDSFLLLCNRPLPENFEVQVEVQFQKGGGASSTEFFLWIQNETHSVPCYQAVFGAHDQQACLFSHLDVERRIFENPPIKPNMWHTLKMRLFDDTLCVYLQEHLLFEYKSDFPLPYNQRSRFALGGWRCSARFRNFIVADLGFPSLIRPTRQGDTLFNAGLFDAARDSYTRILDSRASFADSMELCYKIGRCHVATESFGQAQVWLEKVVSLPENDFWAQQARLQKLYIDLLDNKESARDDTQSLFNNPRLRDETRVLLAQAMKRFEQEGRFRVCTELYDFLGELSEKESLTLLNLQRQSIESLLWLNSYSTAETLLRNILASDRFSSAGRLGVLDDLAYVLTMQGRFDESDQCGNQISELSKEPAVRANTLVHGSRNLRGRRLMDQALNMLERVHSTFESLTLSRAYANLEQSHILCGCNRPVEAQSAINRAEELYPAIGLLSPGSGSTYRYVPLLLLEKFDEAAQMLETDSRAEAGWIFVRAAHLLKASLLWYLAGNENKAKKAQEEVVRRFPEQRCHRMAALATNLLHGQWECLKKLPSSSYHRSEMFYLTALVLERQGQAALSHEFMQMSATEDLSLRWPAALAWERLAEKRA